MTGTFGKLKKRTSGLGDRMPALENRPFDRLRDRSMGRSFDKLRKRTAGLGDPSLAGPSTGPGIGA